MNRFKHLTVEPDIHLTTQGDVCPNCFELVVYQQEPGVPAAKTMLVRDTLENDRAWWQRVLSTAQALQRAHPVYRSRSVVVIQALYDDETDARMLIERVLWEVVRSTEPMSAQSNEAMLLLMELYGAQQTVH